MQQSQQTKHTEYSRYRHFVIGLFLLTLCIGAAADDSSRPVENRLKAAQRAFQTEDWHEALRLYQDLTQEIPRVPIVYIGIGDTAAKLKDYPTAITAFQQALALLSTQSHGVRSRVQAKLAAAYHRNKELDKADTWFQEAVKGAGEEAPVGWYLALGQIETERGNLEQARRYYIVAVQLHPETTAAYNNLGHVLLQLNRIDEADAVFREALTQDGTLATAAFGRGEVGKRRGQFAIAQHFYERAIQHAPDEPLFQKSLVGVLRKTGSSAAIAAAETRYRRTLAEHYLRQAHGLIERKQPEQALTPLKKAIEADGTFTPALKDYGYVQMHLGRLAAAKGSYQRVLTTEPMSRQALLHLGMIEARLGDPAAATAHYLTLIRHDPDFMETYVHLANLRERAGDLDAATEALTMGLQHVPTWAPGYLWRGKLYRKQEKSERAETDFRQAIRLAPDVPFPKEALAALLAAENRDLAEALTLAEAAVKMEDSPIHLATLARVYHLLHRTAEAQRNIEKAFTEAPKDAYVQKIRAEILNTE